MDYQHDHWLQVQLRVNVMMCFNDEKILPNMISDQELSKLWSLNSSSSSTMKMFAKIISGNMGIAVIQSCQSCSKLQLQVQVQPWKDFEVQVKDGKNLPMIRNSCDHQIQVQRQIDFANNKWSGIAVITKIKVQRQKDFANLNNKWSGIAVITKLQRRKDFANNKWWGIAVITKQVQRQKDFANNKWSGIAVITKQVQRRKDFANNKWSGIAVITKLQVQRRKDFANKWSGTTKRFYQQQVIRNSCDHSHPHAELWSWSMPYRCHHSYHEFTNQIKKCKWETPWLMHTTYKIRNTPLKNSHQQNDHCH